MLVADTVAVTVVGAVRVVDLKVTVGVVLGVVVVGVVVVVVVAVVVVAGVVGVVVVVVVVVVMVVGTVVVMATGIVGLVKVVGVVKTRVCAVLVVFDVVGVVVVVEKVKVMVDEVVLVVVVSVCVRACASDCCACARDCGCGAEEETLATKETCFEGPRREVPSTAFTPLVHSAGKQNSPAHSAKTADSKPTPKPLRLSLVFSSLPKSFLTSFSAFSQACERVREVGVC